MDKFGVVIAVALIILNIVGIVFLGIMLGHPFLGFIGYAILLFVIGRKSEIACLIIGAIVAAITLIAIIYIVVTGRRADSIEKKRQQEEKKQRNSDLLDAVNRGDKDAAQNVIEKGADVNCCKALVTAVKNGDKEMVSFLIEKGAKVNLGYDGKLPLDFAEGEELITLLKNYDAITKIEQDRLDIDFVNAVRHGDIEKVKCLIPQISNIDIVIPGHELEAEVVTSNGVQKEALTPLMYAADYYDIEMVKLLVENGANVNAKDSHDHNALMYAVFRHDVIMIDFLSSKGTNVNAKSFNDSGSGITPLMVATDDGNIEAVETLIKNGADVNVKAYNGATALSAAKAQGFTEIENLLRKSGAYR